MDSNPRHFTLHIHSVDVELANQQDHDSVEIVFHGNVTPGDRKRLDRAIVETQANEPHAIIPMKVKRLM